MHSKTLHYTMLNTPIISSILRGIAHVLLKILGWKKIGELPRIPKYVIILAPHTSNWDVFYGVLLAYSLRADAYFMAKHQMFRFPFGPIVRWLGALSIDRSKSSNTVQSIISLYDTYSNFVIALAPEGTRKKVDKWKTGFYNIAMGANIPIVMTYLNYKTKSGGVGGVLYPTGDLEADFLKMKKVYKNAYGYYPEKATLP